MRERLKVLKCEIHLKLSVELHAGLSVEVVARADVRFLVTSEREHWKRNWDGNVDSDLGDGVGYEKSC